MKPFTADEVRQLLVGDVTEADIAEYQGLASCVLATDPEDRPDVGEKGRFVDYPLRLRQLHEKLFKNTL